VPSPRLKPAGLRLVREIRLPAGVDWQAAASNNDGFYAAGFSGSQLLLVRGLWREDPAASTASSGRATGASAPRRSSSPPTKPKRSR
jgi:hypothetical protein